MPDNKQVRSKEIAKFEETFDRVAASKENDEDAIDPSIYAGYITPLGYKMTTLFAEFERDRRLMEERWLKDLRQHRGDYDPETLAKLHPKRSKAFLSLTRTKVKTVSSRMTDLLFPANGDKNWGIEPTPIPELNPAVIESITLQYQEATGQQPDEEMIRKFIHDVAKDRAEAMEVEMADQLSELKYRSIIRDVIKDGNIYGTGILKGPLAKTIKSKRYLPNPDRTGWVAVNLEKVLPYCEHVSIWDVYPDMSGRTHGEMRGVFQRYTMNRHRVYQLSKRPDFNGEAILSYLQAHPNGDAEYKPHENDLRVLNASGQELDAPLVDKKGKYDLYEYWGYLSADELAEQGVPIDPEVVGLEVAANVWMLGPIVIKAIIAPVEGMELPYHFYYYSKDDTSIWGEGIPTIMRDPQKLLNAAVRAMLDNAAISAGPIIEANMDLLQAKENPKDIYPFRVFLREGAGADATAPAIRVYKVPSYTNEYMTMINFFMMITDEVTTVPRYMYGETGQIGSAAKTATGLSMLMGAANVVLKDQVKNFDDGITVPFIKALYFWNMDFNPKEHIKGDFNIVAKGSTSLIAREVKAESLIQFMTVTANPTDIVYTRRDNMLREYAKAVDLDEMDLVKDKNTVAVEEKQRAEAQAKEDAFMKELAIIKASSGGHMSPNLQQLAAGEGLTPNLKPQEELSPGEGPV